MRLYRQEPFKICYHSFKFGGHRHSDNGDIVASAKPHDQRVMRLYRQEPIKVSYHLAKFGGHRHSSSGDIIILVCHVISQDHVIKG